MAMNQFPIELSLKVLEQFSLNELLQLRLVASTWNQRICGLFGSKFVYFIDTFRLAQNGQNLAITLTNLGSGNFAMLDMVCIREIDLLRDDEVPDEPVRSALGTVSHLRIDNSELSIKILCFIVNRMQHLQTLHMSVLLDKSNDSKLVQLRPKAFDSLTELHLSNCSGMEDRCLVRLAGEMHNLQVLNCTQTKMVFYPNVIRRYYQPHDDLDSCWSRPTNFGFTFTIVHAFLIFVAHQLNQIHIGPSVCLDNVTKLLLFDNLKNIHLMFQSKSDADNFKEKVSELQNANVSTKRFHYHTINSN